jgi:hypothetical protein
MLLFSLLRHLFELAVHEDDRALLIALEDQEPGTYQQVNDGIDSFRTGDA